NLGGISPRTVPSEYVLTPLPASPHPVRAAYEALAARGALRPDPAQREAAAALDRVLADLLAARPRRTFGLFEKPQSVRGLYLHGEVGRGKTMLMDLFFAAVPFAHKRRLHFHEFMDEVHAGVAAFRKSKKGRDDNADPVEAVVRPILASGLRLLCLDEFHVHDITNAMLLDRLFGKLFAGGVTLVATSNVAPDDLYRDGLNRQLFLPFIALLKERTVVADLPSEQDYRRLKFAGQHVFFVGEGPAARAAMDAMWLRLTGGEAGAPGVVESVGRRIAVPLMAMGAARFGFSDLCERPL